MPEGISRLTQDQVIEMEEILEAEYVPFYFHDLRTNEIISFHAFLSSLDDSFSVNYDTTKAYGRGEPIMIYNNTSRTISMTFTSVSTNKQDFDHMWWKISKLVTMLYPQWSRGDMITGADGFRFRQPFSQIPTASPLIRLRLGDVFKSNYSRFSLARLFGLGEQSFGHEGDASELWDSAEIQNKSDEFQAVWALRNNRPSAENGWDSSLGAQPNDIVHLLLWYTQTSRCGTTSRSVAVSPAQRNQSLGAAYGDTKKYGYVFPEGYEESKGRVLGMFGVLAPGVMGGTAVEMPNTAMEAVQSLGRSYDDLIYVVELLDPDLVVQRQDFDNPSAGSTEVPAHGLKIAVSAARAEANNGTELITDTRYLWLLLEGKWNEWGDPLSQLEAAETMIEMETFFEPHEADDPDGQGGNPIVRAFESTMGKGLAGVITSMNFNWLDHTWDLNYGSIAPKGCQITLNFQPIHDITPGLDAHGIDRAPVYNVGEHMNKFGGEPHAGQSDDSTYRGKLSRLRANWSPDD